jgi:hypothetical protein
VSSSGPKGRPDGDDQPDGDPPSRFTRAVAAARRAVVRQDVLLEEIPAPRRIAPYSFALTARLASAVDEPATARFVLLHDPSMPDGWAGDQRVVAFLSTLVEADLADDPLLADVAWTWLTDELAAAGARCDELGGTVTRVSSSSFGVLRERPATDQVEVRASWSPRGDLAGHVEGWIGAVCRLAGLPPALPGLVALHGRA